MSEANGQVTEDAAAQIVQAAADAPELELREAHSAEVDTRPWLHPDALVPRDLLRAKDALKDVLDGRHPLDLLDSRDEVTTLIIWAHKSRTDPTFTWEQALDTPYWEFRTRGGPPPPPTGPPTISGSSGKRPDSSTSKPTRPRRQPEPASAPSSTSPEPNTTR